MSASKTYQHIPEEEFRKLPKSKQKDLLEWRKVPKKKERGGAKGILGTSDLADSIISTELYLYIPCKVDGAKKNESVPQLVVKTGRLGKVLSAHYECPRCGACRSTRQACAKHMGLVPNISGNCEGERTRTEDGRARLLKASEEVPSMQFLLERHKERLAALNLKKGLASNKPKGVERR